MERYEIAEVRDGVYTVTDSNDPKWTLGREVSYQTAKEIAHLLNTDYVDQR